MACDDEEAAMLDQEKLVAFVPSRDPKEAKSFFIDVLGLRFISEDPFAVMFDSSGIAVRLVDVSSVKDFKPAAFTVLGWSVKDIQQTVRGLQERGVTFERYPGMTQDDLGVWVAPSGAKVAWFKDPDGNILSVTETFADT
jgi:catechol 2,3-dioxygenase-like lactoylglutathione lyase family enzyme